MTDTFIPAGDAIRGVVLKIDERRRQKQRAVTSNGVTERMFRDSITQLDELQRARGHLIQAWKIYVTQSETVERARTAVSKDFIDIIHQPVTEQGK